MRRKRGAAFIMALVALVILTMVIVSAAAQSRSILIAQNHRLDLGGAERMADSAVQFALAQMQEVDTTVVTNDDDWAIIGDAGDQAVYIGNEYFRVEIIDAGSRINLNRAPLEQLQQLPLEIEQIESLLDWREPDLQPRLEGAKDEYYNTLENPYNVKLRVFDTVDELLLVRGFDPYTLYEIPENTTGSTLGTNLSEELPPLYELLTVDSQALNQNPQGDPKSNVNNASIGQLIQAGLDAPIAVAIVRQRNQQGTYSSWAQLLQVQGITLQNAELLLDNLTLETTEEVTGLINLNTASEAAIASLPGVTPDIANAIISRQATFSTQGDLTGVPGINLNILGQLAGQTTVGGTTFIIRALGVSDTRQVALQVTVRIIEGVPTILRKETYPFVDAVVRWGWQDEAASETTLVELSGL